MFFKSNFKLSLRPRNISLYIILNSLLKSTSMCLLLPVNHRFFESRINLDHSIWTAILYQKQCIHVRSIQCQLRYWLLINRIPPVPNISKGSIFVRYATRWIIYITFQSKYARLNSFNILAVIMHHDVDTQQSLCDIFNDQFLVLDIFSDLKYFAITFIN